MARIIRFIRIVSDKDNKIVRVILPEQINILLGHSFKYINKKNEKVLMVFFYFSSFTSKDHE